MSDVWISLCAEPYREQVEGAMRSIDANAHLRFVPTARELRMCVQEVKHPVGVVIGPLEGPMPPINVAAAMARDGMASSVVLMVPSVTDGLRHRMAQAGIGTVVDLSELEGKGVPDLDEPLLSDDEVPTMLWTSPDAPMVNAQRLPHVEQSSSTIKADAFDDDSDVQTRIIALPTNAPLMTMDLVREQRTAPDSRGSETEDERAGTHAPLIVLASGRGGVGKTALVATMATAARRWGMRVAVCDLDLWFGNLYSCFGLAGPADLGSASHGGLKEQGLLACGRQVTSGLDLWGPCDVPEYAETVYPHVGGLLDQLSHRYDVVLVDTSVSFTDAVAQAVQQCDRLAITVDNREGSGVAQSRLAALAVRLGVARTRILRLANRCGPRGRGEPGINRADIGLETARTIRVLDGGSEVSDCLGEGKVDDLFEIGSRFAESSAHAMAQLLSELGCLPNNPEAQVALEGRKERPRWGFGRKREAM